MKKLTYVLAAFLPLALAACQPVAAPLIGTLYMDVKGPITATEATTATKQGRACAQSILGLVASGDASIEAAAKAGGIKQIVSVDHESHHILGIVGSFCTIVRGN
ncbi:MAG: hypothetical protein KatS3mg077_2708 [Candidatus Binatia bacterium]|nr:MAG: hypothetical protein KatS3mg077_2708 [Candidatus Binatia bacterium]